MTAKAERIEREVRRSGNGAHVFIPKDWIGERVVIARERRKPSVKEVLSILAAHLDNVEGAFLFGSHARGEATSESDVDLLVVASKSFTIKRPGAEVIVVSRDSFAEALKTAPILLHGALAEAKPLINTALLTELRDTYPVKPKHFRGYLRESLDIAGGCRDLIDGEKYAAAAVVYSAVLRLRGVFLVRQLLVGESYTNSKFLRWLSNVCDGASKREIEEAYRSYRDSKSGKPARRISAHVAAALLDAVEKEVQRLRKLIDGKAKKAA